MKYFIEALMDWPMERKSRTAIDKISDYDHHSEAIIDRC